MTTKAVYLHKYWCTGTSTWQEEWGLDAPTTCRVEGDALSADDVTIIDVVEESSVTVKEEWTPTNGKYQGAGYGFSITDAATVQEFDVSFPENITILEMEIVTMDTNRMMY